MAGAWKEEQVKEEQVKEVQAKEVQVKIQLELLGQRPEFLPQLAQWYFDEWGELTKAGSPQAMEQRLQDYLNTDSIPLIAIASSDDELMGAVQLKYREMTIYPEKEHWIGGVYVGKAYRGRGVAAAAIEHVTGLARGFGVKTLHLQTVRKDGGLYRRLGWQPVEEVNYRGIDVLVMQRDI
jgi:GNAT superfamily N-acetyltransferase